jgi:hypothetical protein
MKWERHYINLLHAYQTRHSSEGWNLIFGLLQFNNTLSPLSPPFSIESFPTPIGNPIQTADSFSSHSEQGPEGRSKESLTLLI